MDNSTPISRRELGAPFQAFVEAMRNALKQPAVSTDNATTTPVTRRDFIKTTATAAMAANVIAPALPAAATQTSTKSFAANDWLRFVFRLTVINDTKSRLDSGEPAYLDVEELLQEVARTGGAKRILEMLQNPESVRFCDKDGQALYEVAGKKAGKSVAECTQMLNERIDTLGEALRAEMVHYRLLDEHPPAKKPANDAGKITKSETDPVSPSASPAKPSDLSIALNLADIGLLWEPGRKRLTLSRPPLDSLFTDYTLIMDDKTGALESRAGMKRVDKHIAREALMTQIAELIESAHGNELRNHPLRLIENIGIVIDRPPLALLDELSLKADVPYQSTSSSRGI